MSSANFGIGLTGGGARGAYQAGVLQALSEILKSQNLDGKNNPFRYWSGVSAGSINATHMAANATDAVKGAEALVKLWSRLEPDKVYRTDFLTLSSNSLKWIRDLSFGEFFKAKMAESLLDTEPLWDLLRKNMDLPSIQRQIESGGLNGLACSTYSYKDNRTVTFCQGKNKYHWNRHRRYSKNEDIKIEHIVASCSIPLLFPSVKINDEYFADGSFRNLSPISPLLHMGAQKILMISVRGREEFSERVYNMEPKLARISGIILNALFFDTLEIDLERVRHINEIVAALKKDVETKRSDYTMIDYMVIRPSQDVGKIACEQIKKLPRFVRYLLAGLGSAEESAELLSYILFTSGFTKKLIDLGYEDTMSQKKELTRWLCPN